MTRNSAVTTHPKYRADIDGLRAIAVLSVVGFHAFPGWVRGGFIGVDIFFVISGFLISTIIIQNLQNDTFSFLDFYSRRIKRIFPALTIVLTTCFILGWYVLLPDEYRQLGKHIFAGASFVSNFVLWGESGYFDNSAETKPLLHLWSLGVEEQFYLIWPLIIWFAWRKKFSTLKVIFAVFFVSFFLNIYGIYKNPVATFYSPLTRFWELSCGSLLAWYSIHQRVVIEKISATQGNLLSTVGHALIFASLLLITQYSLFPGWWAVLPISGTVFIILGGTNAWINRTMLSSRGMVWIGLISFPLYLWHWPLLSFAHILQDQPPTRQTRSLAVFFAILLAWMTYKLIEKPIRSHLNQKLKVLILSSAVAVIGVLGLIDQASDGFSFRAGKSAQGALYEEFKENDWSKNWSSTGCAEQYLKISSDCNANSYNPPEVLIIGDSHSQGLYLALAEMAKENKSTPASLMRLGTYLPLLNTSITLKPGVTFTSDETNRELDFSIKSPSVKIIIISFRGVINLTSKDFQSDREISIPDRHFTVKGESQELDLHSAFDKAMRGTLEKLVSSHKEIIFVVDNPELGFHPKECVDMRRFHLTTWSPRNPCAVTREEFDIRNQEYRSLVFSILRSFPSVKVFDTVEALCDSKWCEARREGKFLYQDDNHLSVFGSEIIARRLMKSIGTNID
jgi:peptidoglycan/LPS O-acetylase OafA/YrhL